jgi:hypothetical protein
VQLPPPSDEVVLRPDRGRAALWTVVGLTATAFAAFTFGSSGATILTGLLVLLCAVPTAVFGLQLLAPEMWTVHVDRARVHGSVATLPVSEAVADLRAIELGRVGGDATLVLLGPDRRRTLLLPVGSDLAALRTLLDVIAADRSRVPGRTATSRDDATS